MVVDNVKGWIHIIESKQGFQRYYPEILYYYHIIK